VSELSILSISFSPEPRRVVVRRLPSTAKASVAIVNVSSSGASTVNTTTLADVTLIPQVESAWPFKFDLGRWPLISAVDAACSRLDAFARAASAAQPDAS
jgi:hypothetical protein